MSPINIRSRVEKLERGTVGPPKQVVLLLVDGHSREQISDFLQGNGIRESVNQPIIFLHGKSPDGQSPQPLRILM